jgi:hypothetical protein
MFILSRKSFKLFLVHLETFLVPYHFLAKVSSSLFPPQKNLHGDTFLCHLYHYLSYLVLDPYHGRLVYSFRFHFS